MGGTRTGSEREAVRGACCRCGSLLVWLGLAAIGVAGCASLGRVPAPGWVEGSSEKYPPARYLTGVGQADSRPTAEDRAYGAVARIFKAEISAQSKDWESFLLMEKRGSATTERRLTLDQVTRVTTDKVLENVRILENWRDPRSGQFYALAGMDRAQAGVALSERLAELDSAIAGEMKDARHAPDTLTRVRALHRAVRDLVLREALNADLRVIHASGHGVSPPYRVGDLTVELETLLQSRLVVDVAVTGDQGDVLRRAVTEGLIREGLPVNDGKAGPNPPGAEGQTVLLVRGHARVWGVDVPDPQFRYVRWCSDLTITEAATGRILGAVSKGGREGHLTVQEAAARALRVMQQEVSTELARTLAGYVYGDTEAQDAVPPAACPKEEQPGGPALRPL